MMITRAQSAERIRGLLKTGRSIYRCIGSLQEVARFEYDHSDGDGWDVRTSVPPSPGDVLVGVTARRRPVLVVDACRVTGVQTRSRGGYEVSYRQQWDVPIFPGVSLREVEAAAGLSRLHGWSRLDGDDAAGLMGALADVMARSEPTYHEGEKRIRNCRTRSKKLRQAALVRYRRTCFICDMQPVSTFGDAAERVLESHHLSPLADNSGPVLTDVTEVRLLCASCHRLAHALGSPELSGLKQVRARWPHVRP